MTEKIIVRNRKKKKTEKKRGCIYAYVGTECDYYHMILGIVVGGNSC